MIHGKRVLALIPARGGSKGLPRKNARDFCGKPLIAWSVEQALSSRYVDSTVVSTDDTEIAAIAKEAGAEVPFLRPAALAEDGSKSIDVIAHAIAHLKRLGREYDYLLLLEPTSPLRSVEDIEGALETLASCDGISSIVSVTEAEAAHPAFLFTMDGAVLKPALSVYPNSIRRQDLEQQYFFLEGSVYASTVSALLTNGGFCHSGTAAWVVPRWKSVEIDEICDFIAAEALMRARLRGELT